MKQELKRVDPLRAANVGALVYGVLMTAFALVFFPFLLLAGLLARSEAGPGGMLFAGFALVFYPIMGFVMGWITGLLTAAIYNLVIRWSGGLVLEFDLVPPRPDQTVQA